MLLSELRQKTTTLRSVGASRSTMFKRLGINTVADLLTHFPRSYEDRSQIVSLSSAPDLSGCAVRVVVVGHDYFYARSERTLKVLIRDETSTGSLVCFGRSFLEKTFRIGRVFFVWGRFVYQRGEIQATSFDAEPEGRAPSFGKILPVYNLTEGLGQSAVRKAVAAAVDLFVEPLQDEIPTYLRDAHHLVTKNDAIRWIHFPRDDASLERARQRLRFEELFLFQLRLSMLARDRRARRGETGRTSDGQQRLVESLRSSLPFQLTDGQQRAVAEIRTDMERPGQMTRLLQGDVGSGKTLVAVFAALLSIERGEQVAIMAPTELLARQHAHAIGELLRLLPVSIALVLGSMPPSQRKELRLSVRQGDTHLCIGTHALFSSDIAYARLGLVIIDEQHRFGVAQREQLAEKGFYPDILLMSATPIPRTLALTVFGDTDVSTIDTLPAGRVPVRTHITRQDAAEDVYRFVERELQSGKQAYFVYPRIGAAGGSSGRTAEEMFVQLGRRFPSFRAGIVHSQLPDLEMDRTMSAFVSGELQILVATTVVEVGVDVPNATCMVVDHAELFGLSALHQLRGRVGRSTYQSYCFLMYDPDLTEGAKQRLQSVYETTDGFVLAEKDLELRGPGELVGFRQSGIPNFRIANLKDDPESLQESRRAAAELCNSDPGLLLPEHIGLRTALRISMEEERRDADYRR